MSYKYLLSEVIYKMVFYCCFLLFCVFRYLTSFKLKEKNILFTWKGISKKFNLLWLVSNFLSIMYRFIF